MYLEWLPSFASFSIMARTSAVLDFILGWEGEADYGSGVLNSISTSLGFVGTYVPKPK